MKHQGELLKAVIRAKGLNLKQVATARGVSRSAVDKLVKSEHLSRKVLEPYASVLDFDVNDFYDKIDLKSFEPIPMQRIDPMTQTVPASIYQDLQHNHFELVQSYTELSNKYYDIVIRFFPSAAKHRVKKAAIIGA